MPSFTSSEAIADMMISHTCACLNMPGIFIYRCAFMKNLAEIDCFSGMNLTILDRET